MSAAVRFVARRMSSVPCLKKACASFRATSVSYVDHKRGVYTFYYSNLFDAQDMVGELKRQGLDPENIALYSRFVED